MPGMNGLELQAQVQARGLTLPIIFLTGYGTVPVSVQAMKHGALDFLEKPVDDRMLLDAVFRALDRDREERSRQAEVQAFRERLTSLTPREYEVFALIITGMLNKQVAYTLGASEKTIKVHRSRVMAKLQCDSLAQLARLAEKAGVR
jgi:FixJ family two-component response regulator